MSLYTPWAPSGLSPHRRSSIFDSSFHRDALMSDDRNAQLARLAMNISSLDRQTTGAASLPPIHDLLSAKGLPPLADSSWPTTAQSGPNYRLHPLSQQTDRLENAAQPSRNSPSPLAQPAPTYRSKPMDSPLTMYLQIGKSMKPYEDAPQHSSVISPRPSFHMRPSYAAYASELPKRSKAALAVEDWDHPSFARPPHRPIEPKAKAIEPHPAPISNVGLDVIYDPHPFSPVVKPLDAEPLVPNSYPVPPPPPFEQSAAPLSDLAAEMVWERCFPIKPRGILSPSNAVTSPWDSTFPWASSTSYQSGVFNPSHQRQPTYSAGLHNPSSDWTGSTNTFGAIGAEAKARRFQRQYYSSSASPPSVTSLHTSPQIKKTLGGAKTEVKPAFRRWSRQVLEQTLLSPQVLVLALYYVDRAAGLDVFGDVNGKTSLLPYKMLLASLVLANKTLDDHSYKNSTFSNVSSMTNAEVNAIEAALLKSLNYYVVPPASQWSSWLKEVAATGDRIGFNVTETGLRHPPGGLRTHHHLKAAEPKRYSMDHYQSHPVVGGSIFDRALSPPDFYRPLDVVNESSSWGRMNYQQDLPQPYQPPALENQHRTASHHHHPSQSTAEAYRDQLMSTPGVDLGLTRSLSFAQRAYPALGSAF